MTEYLDWRQNKASLIAGVEAQFMQSLFCPLGRFATLIAGLIMLTCPTAKAQEAAQKNSDRKTVPAPQSMGDTKKSEKKISLSDVAPVSTEEAARSAAQEAAQSPSKNKDDKSASATVDSVLEFRPASQDEQAAAKSDARPSAKHTRKNIHGDAYVGLNPTHSGAHQDGGAVGATSKSGKTSVYVQGDQTRSTPAPH